jgi:hypothetical protein
LVAGKDFSHPLSVLVDYFSLSFKEDALSNGHVLDSGVLEDVVRQRSVVVVLWHGGRAAGGCLHKVRRLSTPKVVLHARPRFSLQQTIYFLWGPDAQIADLFLHL